MIPRLRRFLDVRPGEGLPVLLTFLYIATVVASFLLVIGSRGFGRARNEQSSARLRIREQVAMPCGRIGAQRDLRFAARPVPARGPGHVALLGQVSRG